MIDAAGMIGMDMYHLFLVVCLLFGGVGYGVVSLVRKKMITKPVPVSMVSMKETMRLMDEDDEVIEARG